MRKGKGKVITTQPCSQYLPDFVNLTVASFVANDFFLNLTVVSFEANDFFLNLTVASFEANDFVC